MMLICPTDPSLKLNPQLQIMLLQNYNKIPAQNNEVANDKIIKSVIGWTFLIIWEFYLKNFIFVFKIALENGYDKPSKTQIEW